MPPSFEDATIFHGLTRPNCRSDSSPIPRLPARIGLAHLRRRRPLHGLANGRTQRCSISSDRQAFFALRVRQLFCISQIDNLSVALVQVCEDSNVLPTPRTRTKSTFRRGPCNWPGVGAAGISCMYPS